MPLQHRWVCFHEQNNIDNRIIDINIKKKKIHGLTMTKKMFEFS